jgi:archaellum component FlaC
MAECKDIDRALSNLGKKIDAQNKCCSEVKAELGRLKNSINSLGNRVGKLERDIQSGKQKQTKPQDLTAIYKRLDALENYCLSVEKVFADIEKSFGGIMKQVLGFMDFFSFIFK